jgi:hypothetical protein
MNDFLDQFREAPRPEFADALARRLNRLDEKTPTWTFRSWKLTAAAAGLALAAGATLSVPSVQAAARQFLESFRVKRFAAVPVAPDRLRQLREKTVDIKSLLGENIERVRSAESRQSADAVAAGADVGFRLRLPEGFSVGALTVRGEEATRFTANTEQLKAALALTNVDDVSIPDALNGATIRVTIPASVKTEVNTFAGTVTLLQSRSPKVDLPPGVSMRQLGEIALRVAGLSAEEAAIFSHSVDWSDTLLVPIPATSALFREVTIQGVPGLLVSYKPVGADGKPEPKSSKVILLWSKDDIVFALSGTTNGLQLIEIANALK